MEIYRRNKNDVNMMIKICGILANMSCDKSILEPMYKSGILLIKFFLPCH